MHAFSGDAFKDRSCEEDVFSGGACKDQTQAARMRLAEVLSKGKAIQGGFVLAEMLSRISHWGGCV